MSRILNLTLSWSRFFVSFFAPAVPVYYAMDQALGMESRHAEAFKLNMKVLKKLGDTPTTITGLRDIMQIQKLTKRYTDEEILAFPEMSESHPEKVSLFYSTYSDCDLKHDDF